MNIRAKYPLEYAAKVIPAGCTAEHPEALARMVIARGQAEDAASSPGPSVVQASQPVPKPPPQSPAIP